MTSLAHELRRSFARHGHGWHRMLIAHSVLDATRVVRALARTLDSHAYSFHLRAWLSDPESAADVLNPYRNLARSVSPPTIALVCDTPVLFDATNDGWRRNPFSSRLMRRSLISSSLPTFWWVPQSSAAGVELSVIAPEWDCEEAPLDSRSMPAGSPDDSENWFIARALELSE